MAENVKRTPEDLLKATKHELPLLPPALRTQVLDGAYIAQHRRTVVRRSVIAACLLLVVVGAGYSFSGTFGTESVGSNSSEVIVETPVETYPDTDWELVEEKLEDKKEKTRVIYGGLK